MFEDDFPCPLWWDMDSFFWRLPSSHLSVCNKIQTTPPFPRSESDLKKLPVPLNNQLGLDRFQSPISCHKKKRRDQPPFTSCLEKNNTSFMKYSPNLWNLQNLYIFFFIPSNFCSSKQNQLPVGCWADSTRLCNSFPDSPFKELLEKVDYPWSPVGP